MLGKGKNSLALCGLISVLVCFCAGVVTYTHGFHSNGESPLIDALVGKILPAFGIAAVIFAIYVKGMKCQINSPLRRMIVCGPPPFLLLMIIIGVAIVFARLFDR
jgi:hypothetical protein